MNGFPTTVGQPAAPQPMMSEGERSAKLQQWMAAKKALDLAKENEKQLREEIVEKSGLFSDRKVTGTETVHLGNGWKVKAVKKQNYNLESYDDCEYALNELRELGEGSARIAEDLIKYTPRLSVSTYNKLTEAELAIIQPIVTITKGMPTLEIVPPKGQ